MRVKCINSLFRLAFEAREFTDIPMRTRSARISYLHAWLTHRSFDSPFLFDSPFVSQVVYKVKSGGAKFRIRVVSISVDSKLVLDWIGGERKFKFSTRQCLQRRCSGGKRESILHFIFWCEQYAEERRDLDNEVAAQYRALERW